MLICMHMHTLMLTHGSLVTWYTLTFALNLMLALMLTLVLILVLTLTFTLTASSSPCTWPQAGFDRLVGPQPLSH